MLTIALAFLGSTLLSAIFVATSIRVAKRWNIHDAPDGQRKLQEHPIPKLGGVAFALSFSLAAVILTWLVGGTQDAALAISVLVPAVAAALVGFSDDRKGLSPWLRLILQIGIAALAWSLGTQIDLASHDLLNFIIFVLWFVAIVNGVNLLDNSDGLAGSTTFVAALGATAIALFNGQELVSLLAIALAGVALGFLWHNWYPATVYMGDSGAYFLGALLAIVLVRLKPLEAPPLAGISIALLLALLPILDTTYVFLKRVRAGTHPFTAGRDHLSHVLQNAGLSIPQSVLLMQILSLTSAGLAVIVAVAY
jgi:UDP-GlcNAc:undecaprenyl-phosphate GlcNAc-1-phosphate transferase